MLKVDVVITIKITNRSGVIIGVINLTNDFICVMFYMIMIKNNFNDVNMIRNNFIWCYTSLIVCSVLLVFYLFVSLVVVIRYSSSFVVLVASP